MYALNNIQIIGNLTEDPQVREIGSGTSVADLNIEVKMKNPSSNSEYPTISTFVTATLWSRMAEIARDYVKKGTQVYLAGRLETDSWEDDKGNKKYKTKMVAQDMIILTPKTNVPEGIPSSLLIAGGINKVELIGNFTKDPELKTTPNGAMVSNFSIATNRSWKDKSGEQQEKTEFHNIVVWNELAEEVSKHLVKGRKAYITGRLQTRSWEGPDGSKRYTTEVVATEIKSLGHTSEGGSSNSTPAAESSAASAQKAVDNVPEINYESEIKAEDLPF